MSRLSREVQAAPDKICILQSARDKTICIHHAAHDTNTLRVAADHIDMV